MLLKNDGVLPLAAPTGTLAVVGPNAERTSIMGGGSAQLVAHYKVTILDALRDRLGDQVEIVHEPGADTVRSLPVLGGGGDDGAQLVAPDGSDGLALDVFAGPDFAGEPVERQGRPTGELFCFGPPSPAAGREFSARLTGTITAERSGRWQLSLAQSGAARLLVDGAVVIDGMTRPLPPGPSFFGTGSEEVRVEVDLVAGQPVEIVVELANPTGSLLSGVRVGARPAPPADLLDRAVAAAAAADAVLVVVGTSNEWESEGHDRDDMDLPGGQDELIARVLDVAPDAVVVLNAAAPVTMPWADRAKAIAQVWFGGQEAGNGVVDVLTGDGRSRRAAADHDPRAARAQPVVRQLPARGRRHPLRRGPAGRLPLVRGPAPADPVPVRPRAVVHDLLPRPTPAVVVDLRPRDESAGRRGRRHQHRLASGERGGAVLRRPSRRPPGPPAQGAEGVRQGDPRPGRRPRRSASSSTPGRSPTGSRMTRPRPSWRRGMQTFLTSSRPAAASDDTAGWTIDAGTHQLHIGRSSADIAHVVEVEIPARRVPGSGVIP